MNTPTFTQASINISDMAQTWNAGATTFTAIKMNVTDTASAAGSKLLDLQVGGVSRFVVPGPQSLNIVQASYTGLDRVWLSSVSSGGSIQVFSAATNSFLGFGTLGSTDTNLFRESAGVFGQRNGTNPQTFRVYNTFTDASNYERLAVAYSGSDARIQTEKAGTGAARSLVFGTDANARWLIGATSGHFLAGADNIYDIGASGANRPRNVFVGNTLTTGAIVTSMASGILFTGGGYIVTPSNGVMKITNNSDTGFNRLQFGGTTASFPSISRNAANIDFRLADDSALTGIGAASVSVAASTTARPHFALTAGVAPTSPANGDIWFDGTDMKIRIGGVTKTFTII